MIMDDEAQKSMTAKRLVSLSETQRYEFYETLFHIKELSELEDIIKDLSNIDKSGEIFFEMALNLRTAINKSSIEEQQKFFSHKAAECLILSALHKDEFTKLTINRHFKKAIPVLENYEGDRSVFNLLVKMAEDNWVKSNGSVAKKFLKLELGCALL
jgi:hypothetical protein